MGDRARWAVLVRLPALQVAAAAVRRLRLRTEELPHCVPDLRADADAVQGEGDCEHQGRREAPVQVAEEEAASSRVLQEGGHRHQAVQGGEAREEVRGALLISFYLAGR